jgi:hypothetical protein
MAKPKTSTLVPVQIADNLPLETLAEMFVDFCVSVEKQINAENDDEVMDGRTQALLAAEHALATNATAEELEQAKAKRDALIAFIFALEAQEARLRHAVKNAEVLARRYKARAEYLKSSVQFFMRDNGIERIEGLMHRFANYKQPDQLVISREDQIPAEFFDEVPTVNHILNKERLMAALVANEERKRAALEKGQEPEFREVAGAYIEKNRTRLDVK